MNHLRTGGCGLSQTFPENQSPLIFPASIRALQPRGLRGKSRKRRGQALVAKPQVVSFFFLHSICGRNIPGC